MEMLSGPDAAILWVFALGVTMMAGVIKGVVGFAMPMVMISGLGSIMAPDLALAALIVPTLVTNLWQALRQGPAEAWRSMKRFRVFLICGGVMMLSAAQLVPVLPAYALYLVIGVPVTIYAALSLAGRAIELPPNPSTRMEAGIGATTGVLGGLSGVWGPTTVAMLTAQGTEKREQMRVQGVIYGLGAVMLMIGHLGSGVLRLQTLPLSLAMVPPALLGIWCGFAVQDRIDQRVFRKITLIVLLVGGANLLRRGIVAM